MKKIYKQHIVMHEERKMKKERKKEIQNR